MRILTAYTTDTQIDADYADTGQDYLSTVEVCARCNNREKFTYTVSVPSANISVSVVLDEATV